ncbi:hypothetical protein C8J57DRAFT_1578435 [Mycena rebaudengoi]|nr:hypothetical protein C8J57DRAFT_1578435 [Mycena rebaudengoi]
MSSAIDVFEEEASFDDRESLSSSEWVSTSSKRSSHPYITPDGRSQASSVDRRAKEKLATLTNLEFSCGLQWKQFHIDTTRNLLYLRVDLHRSFDKNGWILLPDADVLQSISQHMNDPQRRTYKQVLLRRQYTYRIIPLQLSRDNISVFRRVSSASEDPQYETINLMAPLTVESHINPFFAIANAGPKIESHSNLLPQPWRGHADIAQLLLIWTQMKNVEPARQWFANPYQGHGARRGGGSRGGGGYGGGRGSRDGGHGSRDGGHGSRDGGHGSRDGGHGSRDGGNNSGDGDGDASPPSRHTRFSGDVVEGDVDLPELDQDNQTHMTESDVLTLAALRTVPVVDRTHFLAKWLGGILEPRSKSESNQYHECEGPARLAGSKEANILIVKDIRRTYLGFLYNVRKENPQS